jgi:hypothetical protein
MFIVQRLVRHNCLPFHYAKPERGCTSKVGIPYLDATPGDSPSTAASTPQPARSGLGSILDGWHISKRVRHIERAVRRVYALEPQHRSVLEMVEWRIRRLRRLIWNGYHEEAHREPLATFRPAVARLLWNRNNLRLHLPNNTGSLIDHVTRYRFRLPISTSRVEGRVGEITNARTAKKPRMKWSPQGTHRVTVVRAAVLDGCLSAPRAFP